MTTAEKRLAEIREQIQQFQQDRRKLAQQTVTILTPYTEPPYPEDIQVQAKECLEFFRKLSE